MNIKKLFSVLFALLLFAGVLSAQSTVYVDATNGSDFYTGANETNNPAGTGPKATLAAALPLVTNGGTIVVKAGTYTEALDFSTGLVAGVTSYTLQVKQLNANTDAVFTGVTGGNHGVINKVGLTVNVTRFGTTERFLSNPGAAKVITLTNGTINLVDAAVWTIQDLAGGQLTATINVAGAAKFTGAAPTIGGVGATTGIILNYTGGTSFTAGPEGSYANYGGIGQINVGKTAGTTVTFASAIAFNAANTLDVINVTTGGAVFQSTINLGLGDIVNAGANAVTVSGLVSAGVATGAGVADADLSSVVNSAAGSITLTGGITWTAPALGGAKNYGALYAVDLTGAGSISTGAVSFVANNTAGSGNYTLGFNNGAGTLSVGVVTAASSGSNNFYGVLNLVTAGGTTTTVAGGSYRGAVTNAGTLTTTGAMTVLGAWNNTGGSTTVGAALSVGGILTINNATAFSLGANTLTLTGAVAHATNGGTITASTGGVLVNSAGATSFNGGTLSNVTVSTAATALTLQTNAINVTNLIVNTGATVTVAIGTTASGTVTVEGGTLTINNARTLTTQNFVENSGVVNLGGGVSGVLDVKGNFSRTGGTFAAGVGSLLSFTGTVAQTVDGGPLFQVVNLTFTNSVSPITVNNTIRATGISTISTATTVNFGTVNLVLNSATASLINNGVYNTTAGSGGGVILGGINLVPLGAAGAVAPATGPTIEGTGIFSYITVDVGQGNQASVINTLTGVKFNGVLRLYSGDLDVATAGVDFSPFGTSAKIVKHLFNAGAQCALLTTGGTWNAALVTYDLEYANGTDNVAPGYLTADVDVTTGTLEFPAGLLVKDLTISAVATTGSAQIVAARTFTGNLTVATGAILNLNGVAVTSTKTGAAHVVSGLIEQQTPAVAEELILTGNGTLSGGAGVSSINSLDVNTAGAYTITGLKVLGNAANVAGIFEVRGGAQVTLTMATIAANNYGDLWWALVTNGTVTLGNHVDVTGTSTFTVAAAGIFDFANYNVQYFSTGNFTSAAASVFNATGASTGGYLQVRANFNINTAGALLPRIIMDPAAAGAYTLTLTGNTGVKDIFTGTGNDILALGANVFEHNGNIWNHGGTQTYTGTGVVNITGPVVVNLGANAVVPNLTLNNGANIASLVDNDGVAGTIPSVEVVTLFTMTAGTLNQNACDINLTAAGGVFAYTAGTLQQTSVLGVAATDLANGELVFNNAGAQTFTVGATQPVFPNVRFAGAGGVTNTTANPWTVSKRFVFGASNVVVATTAPASGAGKLTFADGAWVERRGAGLLRDDNPATVAPTFAGVVDVYYQAGGAYAVASELPTAAANAAALRHLFVNTNVNAIANIQVNGSLNLIANAWDPEPGATTYTITMAPATNVIVTDGTITAPAGTAFMLAGGPVTLTYQNTGAYAITAREFPTTAAFVSTLNANPNGATLTFPAAGTRSVGDFVMNANAAATLFDLNGGTLTVTNTSSSTLTRGTLISQRVVAGVYVYGTLTNAGSLTTTANSTITNVNVTTATATLAGVFNSVDIDGAGVNVLPAVNPLMTVTGDAAVAGFAGDLTVNGNTTLNGAYGPGTLTAKGNVTFGTNGAAVAPANLVFNGAANQNLTVPAAGVAINALTLNQTTTSTITLVGGNLTTTGLTTFTNGVFVTGDNTFTMWHPNWNVSPLNPQGFNRAGVTGTNVSHVVGNVAKRTVNAGIVGWVGTSEPRVEFPVGTATLYRPAVLTFGLSTSGGVPTVPNNTFTVKYVHTNPQGQTALPIAGGVKAGTDIARYPSFYWYIKAATSVDPSLRYDLELDPTGFTGFGSNAMDARIIRRHGAETDVNNSWLLQGYEVGVAIDTKYDNEYNVSTNRFAVINRQSLAGLRADGAVFTLGLSTNLATDVVPTNATAKVATVRGVLTPSFYQNYVLNMEATSAKLFKNNVGALRYTVLSGNTAIATASVAGAVLTVVPVAVGTANITVTAFDDANNDFMSYTFQVSVGVVGNDKQESAIPTEFAMSQNYPNPFNPTTAIKFALPKESHVTIKVINMIGQEVASLVDEVRPAGYHVINFNANGLASGNYIAIIKASEFTKTIKMSLLK